MNTEKYETLKYRCRFLELLHKETKLKAQRMALSATYFENLYKRAVAKDKTVMPQVEAPPHDIA